MTLSLPRAARHRRRLRRQTDDIHRHVRGTNPVLADEDGGLIAGEGRLLAARQLGYGEVPVMVARGWSDAQKRAYVIADNQLALNAGWNRELLGLAKG
jgi:ParB-like chromosome segregation protein Spo0J